MSTLVNMSQQELQDLSVEELKKNVEKDAWVSLKQYFDGRGTEPEAKAALTALGILTKKLQARNNERQKRIASTPLK